jgi:vancomycin resistance protein VanJ
MINVTQSPSRSLRLRLFNLLLALIDVYAFGLIVYVLLRLLTQDRLWPMLVINHIIHWLLLPSVLTMLLLLGLRRWRRAALNAVGAAAFMLLFGELFLPALPSGSACAAAETDCHQLRVMTFNIHAEPNSDVSSEIVAMSESGADVIALQEMSTELAAAIETELIDEYPYQALHPLDRLGTGIISKIPFDEVEAFKIGDLYLTIRAVILIDNTPVTIFCTHTAPPAFDLTYGYVSLGRSDIETLVELADAHAPTLILGDFNTVDQLYEYRIFRDAGYGDAFREAGWGFGSTFPDHNESFPILPRLMRIDYIFHSVDIRAIRAWVGPETYSDHRSVIADLVVTP